ncbi:fluoride efflux transporter CrcB, partial [Ferviditalea candida]|nr:fluoride efflux transporter CrcB [Paenibacillaceae bacterium T2]
GIGGIIGSLLRYFSGRWISSKSKGIFPWGTWAINLSGSFLFGLLFALNTQQILPDWLWYFAGPGFCGAYTTFSAFGYEAIHLFEENHARHGFLYILATVGLGLLATWAGLRLGLGIL